MSKFEFWALYVAFGLCFHHIYCYDIYDVKALLRNKTEDYDRKLRPTINQSEPTVVYVGMELISVLDFDEVKETLTVTAFLTLGWFDEFMTWDVDEYNNMSEIILENEQFWTPNLVLVNSVQRLKRLSDPWIPIRFVHSGTALFYPGDVFSATCSADIRQYPLDSHWCTFTFTPWAYSENEIYLYPYTYKILTSFYSENGAWKFIDSHVQRTGRSDISFFIRLDRKPVFVIVSIIMPVICMTFLNAMVFWIPTESGERMSYSITVLLAIAVFLTIVGENMPKTSNPISHFSYYLSFILLVSVAITLSTILSLRIFHHTDTEPVTGCWAYLARLTKCRRKDAKNKYKRNVNGTFVEEKCLSKTVQSVYDVDSLSHNEMMNKATSCKDIQDISRDNLQKQYKRKNILVKEATKITPDVDDHRHTDISWKDASMALDKCLFKIFMLLLAVITAGFFVSIILKEKEE